MGQNWHFFVQTLFKTFWYFCNSPNQRGLDCKPLCHSLNEHIWGPVNNRDLIWKVEIWFESTEPCSKILCSSSFPLLKAEIGKPLHHSPTWPPSLKNKPRGRTLQKTSFKLLIQCVTKFAKWTVYQCISASDIYWQYLHLSLSKCHHHYLGKVDLQFIGSADNKLLIYSVQFSKRSCNRVPARPAPHIEGLDSHLSILPVSPPNNGF